MTEELTKLISMIECCRDLAKQILDTKPIYGREIALVRTKLEEARMWAIAC